MSVLIFLALWPKTPQPAQVAAPYSPSMSVRDHPRSRMRLEMRASKPVRRTTTRADATSPPPPGTGSGPSPGPGATRPRRTCRCRPGLARCAHPTHHRHLAADQAPCGKPGDLRAPLQPGSRNEPGTCGEPTGPLRSQMISPADRASGSVNRSSSPDSVVADRTLDKPYFPRPKALFQANERPQVIPGESPRLGELLGRQSRLVGHRAAHAQARNASWCDCIPRSRPQPWPGAGRLFGGEFVAEASFGEPVHH